MRAYALTTLRDIVDENLGPIEAVIDIVLSGPGAKVVKAKGSAVVYGGDSVPGMVGRGADFSWVLGYYDPDD